MVSFDETGKINSNENDRNYTRQMIWNLVFGGGQFEMHTAPMATYQEFANLFADILRLKNYMARLAFWNMRPRNDLATGNAVVFAGAGHELTAYSSDGSRFTLNLLGFAGRLACEWYNPRSGAYVPAAAVTGGGPVTLTPPFGPDSVLHLGAYSAGISNRDNPELAGEE